MMVGKKERVLILFILNVLSSSLHSSKGDRVLLGGLAYNLKSSNNKQ